MRLHVFTGEARLMRPGRIPHDALAATLDEPAAAATAFWIAPDCGRDDHDFLVGGADGDRRLAIFARSLRENFGERTAPFVVLTRLAAGDAGAVRALCALAREDACDAIRVHLISLAPENDPDPDPDSDSGADPAAAWRALEDAFGDGAVEGAPVDLRRLDLTPEDPPFEAAFRNALAAAVTARLTRARLQGFAVDPDVAVGLVRRMLAAAPEAGLRVTTPLDEDDLAALARAAGRLIERRLARATAGAEP